MRVHASLFHLLADPQHARPLEDEEGNAGQETSPHDDHQHLQNDLQIANIDATKRTASYNPNGKDRR